MTAPRLFVLCAPVRFATPAQLRERDEVKRRIIAAGGCPVFLPDSLRGFVDDEIPAQRDAALRASFAFVQAIARTPSAQMVIVGNTVSEGMQLDIQAWLMETAEMDAPREPITPVRALKMLAADAAGVEPEEG